MSIRRRNEREGVSYAVKKSKDEVKKASPVLEFCGRINKKKSVVGS